MICSCDSKVSFQDSVDRTNLRFAAIDSIVDQQQQLIREWVPADAISVEDGDTAELSVVSQGLLYLGQKIMSLHQEVENGKKLRQAINDEKQALCDSLDELKQERNRLQEQINELTSKPDMSSELTHINEEKKEIEVLLSETENKLHQMEQERHELNSEKQELENTIGSLKSEIDSLKSTNEELRSTNDSLKSEIDSLKSSDKSSEYIDQINSLKSDNDSLKSEIDSLKSSDKSSEYIDQINSLKSTNEELKINSSKSDTQILELTKTVDTLTEEKASLSKLVSDLNTEIDNMKLENNSYLVKMKEESTARQTEMAKELQVRFSYSLSSDAFGRGSNITSER